MILLKLFLSFLKTGLCAIGGAYSFIPLLQRELVAKYSWLTQQDFERVVGASRVFPGAISIKFATYTGYRVAGVPGIIVANVGNLLGPVVLVLGAMKLYDKYRKRPQIESAFNAIQFAVFAMLIVIAFQLAGVSNFINNLGSLKSIAIITGAAIIAGCFALFAFTKIHPALIIIAAGIAGALLRI